MVEAAGGTGKDFAERRVFGRYLRGILDEAVASGLVEVVEARALSARREGEAGGSKSRGGGEVMAGALALAQGNQPPEPLRGTEQLGACFVNNPWVAESATAIARVADSDGDALIVGTGLTMVDMVLSLDAAGHRGRIVALSRRGQIPRAHADFEPAPVELDAVPLGNVAALWRWLRRRAGEVGWRAAVDSLRPHSHAIWKALDAGERRRFVRHARPWWDVHRHRIAPQVAAQIADMVGEGRLEIVAGRIGAMREVDGWDRGRDFAARAAHPRPLPQGREQFRRRVQLHRAAGSDQADARSLVEADARRRAGRGGRDGDGSGGR